jgi:uncharacterized protein YndB with AHSA1/START domain
MSTPTQTTIQVKHRFAASAERVFNAWLDPKRAGKFLFATPTGEMVRVEIDARIGGSFCIVERRAGEDIAHVGEYLEIERPLRLVFAFAVPKFSSEKTRVTIEIADLGPQGCELTLTHTGMLPDYADRTQAGWVILDAQARMLG